MVPSPKFLQGLTTLNNEEYFPACSYWTSGIPVYGSCKLSSSFDFLSCFQPPALISPSPTFPFCNLFPYTADLVLLPSVKEGIFALSNYFSGSLQNRGTLPLAHSSAVSLKKFIMLLVWVILLSSSLTTPSVLWNLTANISADHM